jgi:hypothetical protein
VNYKSAIYRVGFDGSLDLILSAPNSLDRPIDYYCLSNGNLLAMIRSSFGNSISIILVNGVTLEVASRLDFPIFDLESVSSTLSSDGTQFVFITSPFTWDSPLALNVSTFQITSDEIQLTRSASIGAPSLNATVTSCVTMVQDDTRVAVMVDADLANYTNVLYLFLFNVSDPEENELMPLIENPFLVLEEGSLGCSVFPQISSEPRAVIFGEQTYDRDGHNDSLLQWNTQNLSVTLVPWHSSTVYGTRIGYSSPYEFQTTRCSPHSDIMECELLWYQIWEHDVTSDRKAMIALQPYDLQQVISTDSDLA